MPMNAKEILSKNLRAMMRATPLLRDRPLLAARSKISERAIGYMLQKKGGNPTLAHIEAVAGAFKLEAWELLIDHGETKRRLIAKILNGDHASDERLRENGIFSVKSK